MQASDDPDKSVRQQNKSLVSSDLFPVLISRRPGWRMDWHWAQHERIRVTNHNKDWLFFLPFAFPLFQPPAVPHFISFYFSLLWIPSTFNAPFFHPFLIPLTSLPSLQFYSSFDIFHFFHSTFTHIAIKTHQKVSSLNLFWPFVIQSSIHPFIHPLIGSYLDYMVRFFFCICPLPSPICPTIPSQILTYGIKRSISAYLKSK